MWNDLQVPPVLTTSPLWPCAGQGGGVGAGGAEQGIKSGETDTHIGKDQ